MKKILKVFLIIVVLGVALVIFGALYGDMIVVRKYQFESPEITKTLKIVQLSDLHSMPKAKYNQKLLEKLNKLNPDIILLTGDVITNIDDSNTIPFLKKLTNYKTYFVSGNHEYDVDYMKSLEQLEEIGIILLEDKAINYNQELNLIGVSDIPGANFSKDNFIYNQEVTKIENIVNSNYQEDKLNILLMHRPHYFETISKTKIDYVFSGHVHGGQWQIPLVGGFLGPDQGFFPKYDKGLYTKNDSSLIVSTGLERKYSIPRLFNPREIIYVELN